MTSIKKQLRKNEKPLQQLMYKYKEREYEFIVVKT